MILDEADQAIKSLNESIDAGFKDLRQFDREADFESLRNREDFKKVRERLVTAITGNPAK